MKVYPKIPRYDHPTLEASLFDAPDLTLIEKVDGSAFRFTLFEDRFRASYPEVVVEAAAGDGSLVFGTRKSIRGSHRDDLDEIDGALHRAVRCLRTSIDRSALRAYHDRYDGPLIVYAENLVYSTLDYGFSGGDLPALLGFDVLPYSEIDTMTPAGNPYDESFAGFLPVDEAWALFEAIRTDASTDYAFVPAPIVGRPGDAFDPETYDVPDSAVAPKVQAEGVVVRSDSRDARCKLVRTAFQELNRERFGQNPAEATTGAEYVVAKYCTAGRIRKQLRTMVLEEGREFGLHLNDELYERVVEDIWAENWPELMRLDRELTPADVYPLVAQRCITELRTMQTNADLNDADPTTLWRHLE